MDIFPRHALLSLIHSFEFLFTRQGCPPLSFLASAPKMCYNASYQHVLHCPYPPASVKRGRSPTQTFLQTLLALPQTVLDQLNTFLSRYPAVGGWYTTLVRFLFPVLAVLILAGAIRSLLTVPHLPEVWAYLSLPNGANVPLMHWENILGRSPSSDVVLEYSVISRQHAALIRRPDESWTVYDLDSKTGVLVNGEAVQVDAEVHYGDVVSLGGVETVLLPLSPKEREERRASRKWARPISPWGSLVLLTLFQVLTAIQLTLSEGENATAAIPAVFLCLTGLMWLYFLTLRALRRVGFEMETIAFFLSTLGLAVVASSNTPALPKQFFCLVLGLAVFLGLVIILRDLERVKTLRWMMAAAAIGLLVFTLLLGSVRYGAKNWITIAGFSFQPSEFAKICYIFAGAATLDRLFRKRNLALFIVLTGVCLGCLALMSDFGAAAIFFVTFLVIAYLRSGDWATLGLITGAAVGAVLVILSVKPYILNRFASWGHAWENISTGAGYQQTRAMAAAASGGLIGVGPGEGWLHIVGAGDTDLVFGMLCEEWGLLIASLSVLCIVTLAIFAVRACRTGRSAFYTIAACAATSLLVFQSCLNVFGCMDLLPMTGVTFPFVSNGGSAMITSWGLLAFLKATDTRQNASFAVRLPSKREKEAQPTIHRKKRASKRHSMSDTTELDEPLAEPENSFSEPEESFSELDDIFPLSDDTLLYFYDHSPTAESDAPGVEETQELPNVEDDFPDFSGGFPDEEESTGREKN